jgi:hypothetical protein
MSSRRRTLPVSSSHVIGGHHPPAPALIAEVEDRADEIVRAAAALYLDGSSYEGSGEGVRTAFVTGGMFLYLVVPRHQRAYVMQVTTW